MITEIIGKQYLHVDNGGIFLTVNKENLTETYSFSVETSYCGYPNNVTTLTGLDKNQLKFIKQFFINLKLE